MALLLLQTVPKPVRTGLHGNTHGEGLSALLEDTVFSLGMRRTILMSRNEFVGCFSTFLPHFFLSWYMQVPSPASLSLLLDFIEA